MEVLIASKTGVNKHDEYDDTAMKLAAQHGHLKCVEVLIQAEADVNKWGKHDNTALMRAAQCGKAEGDVNKQDEHGWTAVKINYIHSTGCNSLELCVTRSYRKKEENCQITLCSRRNNRLKSKFQII